MFKSWKLGRVAGIDLFIHPTFWLLMLFVVVSDGGWLSAAFLAAVFGCVVLHELGHALTARLYGIATRDITLYPIGGVASLERMPRSPGAELAITLAGPLTNVAIAGVLGGSLAFAEWMEPGVTASSIGHFVGVLAGANLALAAFNMIPAFPMDGGRVFRALLASGLGRVRATRIAAELGRSLALVVPVLLLFTGKLGLMHMLLAAFVYMAAGAELQAVLTEERRRQGTTHAASRTPFTPPGYRWVQQAAGVWVLAPIVAGHVRPGAEASSQGIRWWN